MNAHLLSLLLAVPFFGALVVLFLPRQWHNTIRRFSVGVMLVELAISTLLLPEVVEILKGEGGFGPIAFAAIFGVAVSLFTEKPKLSRSVVGALGGLVGLFGASKLFQLAVATWGWETQDFSTGAYHFVEDTVWIEALGVHYKLGIDGISLWLVMLTTLLTPIALYASWSSVETKVKEYALAFLVLQVGMLGAFFALDLFLFYIFWELMLVPMYLIIGIWGGKDRVYAAVKFFLYTMVGSLLMLIAILYVVHSFGAACDQANLVCDPASVHIFGLDTLGALSIPLSAQVWLFAAFALAFAIKVPMFPFHTWLPDAHTQAPTGGSIILAAVLLKLGTYGFLRFAMPLFPLASQLMGPTIAMLGVVGIIYGAWCAWVQKDVKKLVAYSSVSHMGFIALGIFAMTEHGIQGAIIQMVNHGVSTGALFILVGVIYERRHTRELDAFGGLAKVMPMYAVLFVLVSMSSIGLPGTNGFIGEFLIMSGAWMATSHIGLGHWSAIFTLLAATGVILAAIYMLHAVLKMFWGPVKHKENENLPDLTVREWSVLAPLVVFIFWIGVHPSTFLDKSEPAVTAFIQDFQQKYNATEGAGRDALRLLYTPEGVTTEGEAEAADNGAEEGGDEHAALEAPGPLARLDGANLVLSGRGARGGVR